MRPDLSPENLLSAYACGIFPMADEQGRLHWLSPDPRAILDLDAFIVPRTLRTTIRQGRFDVTFNESFSDVVAACADRPSGTWISDDIRDAYVALHRLGFAHSVETRKDGDLAGGLYGVALGGAFFGESMFHRESDASKIALVGLVQRMRERGFVLLDIQFRTAHLDRFGAVEIPRADYQRRLRCALRLSCRFADSDSDRGRAHV